MISLWNPLLLMKTVSTPSAPSSERRISAINGWAFLALNVLLYLGALLLFISTFTVRAPVLAFAGVLVLLAGLFVSCGFFTLQPNEACVLVLFGAYQGSVRDSGFFWTNPFNKRIKLSLRSRNRNGEKLKVNDKRGNPIEIAAVVVWRVQDTAQASFDVDNYEHYVEVQSESAVRHVATGYAYDDSDDAHEITLRASTDAVNEALRIELQERLQRAGVTVEEARLTHLAYAPEIAQVMLRRQQAEAIIAARSKIVKGAVGMVELALRELEGNGVVELDAERKAAMVSNLLVVLCGEAEVTPVVNTGTLYS